MKTKTLVIGALLAVIAAFFQVMPVLFSEAFIFITILSTIPIFIVCRINPKAGVLSYIVASILVLLISTHEGLLFLSTNGVIGVTLGVCRYYTIKRTSIILSSSITLTITLSIMNYGLGIPVLGKTLPGGIITQLVIFFLFSLIYNYIYYYFLEYIVRNLKKTNVFIDTNRN